MLNNIRLSRRSLLAASAASFAVIATAGCTANSASTGTKTAAATGGTLRLSLPPVPHLDVAINGAGSNSGDLMLAGLLEGLVVDDPTDQTKVLPGVAEKWDISSDGLTYTFHLRSNAKWSNGDPVTASDFVFNWERGLNPATAGNNVSSFAPVAKTIAGGAAYFSGVTTDFSTVGIKAVDSKTFEIKLSGPNPDFLNTLSLWKFLPLHPATVQANPNLGWMQPDVWVGNGPYVLKTFVTNGSASMAPNPTYWDKANYTLDAIQIRFNNGGSTVDLLSYQNNEIDAFRIEADLASVTSDPKIAKQLVKSQTNQWRGLLLLNSANPALYDKRVRQALSMAIDRNQIASIAAPDVAGFSLVPSSLAGNNKVTQTKLDVSKAKSLMSDAGFPGGKGFPKLSLLLYAETPWVEAITQMWQKNLGVEAAIDVVEVGVYGQKRLAANPASYCGFSYGNFGDNPATFHEAVEISVTQSFDTLSMPSAAYTQYLAISGNKNLDPKTKAAQLKAITDANVQPEIQQYIDLCTKADAATDTASMNKLLTQAANAREASYMFIPVLWGGYNWVISPKVKGLHVVPGPEDLITKGTYVSK